MQGQVFGDIKMGVSDLSLFFLWDPAKKGLERGHAGLAVLNCSDSHGPARPGLLTVLPSEGIRSSTTSLPASFSGKDPLP